MKQLQEFYNKQKHKHEQQLQLVKKRLAFLATVRLFVFLGLVGVIYLLWGSVWLWGLVPMGLSLFLVLVARFANLKSEKGYLERLIMINETEMLVLQRKFHHLPDGREFLEPEHPYAQDLDLFGRGSFYQYLNRTTLDQGSGLLAGQLLDDRPKDIQPKQDAIQELAKLPEWRQRFWALAGGTRPEVSHDVVSNWLKEHKPFLPKWIKYGAPIFTLISVLVVVLGIMGQIPEALILYWYLFGLLLVGSKAKRLVAFSTAISKVQDTIDQYQRLILELEQQTFQSDLLKEKQEKLLLDGQKTSKVLQRFTQRIGMLDQQNNLLVLMLGQGFMLWSLYFAYQVEDWVIKYGHQVEGWFEAIAFFDAYNCLGNYAFNHPDHTFPKIMDEDGVLHVKAVGHPLIAPTKNILNDFSINKGRFCIVTGANMAGKSTFLRAVGLQIVMANMGLPILGKEVKYAPVRLLTSMRSSDSLTDETSYFYAELKRLKFIVEELEKRDCFIILDEILKGTNSVDKAEGSKKFVERLVLAGATGLIATHDLSLCTLADVLPEVENRYFDAQIKNDELYFDYQFKEGICQNMNASFLLKHMGIVD